MKKTLLFAVIAGVIGAWITMSSCETLSQAQQQVFGTISLESTTMVAVEAMLEKHPEGIDLFKSLATNLTELADRDKLSIDDIRKQLYAKIDDKIQYGNEDIKNGIDNLLSRLSLDMNNDLLTHREELRQIASGIEWGIQRYCDKHGIKTGVIK